MKKLRDMFKKQECYVVALKLPLLDWEKSYYSNNGLKEPREIAFLTLVNDVACFTYWKKDHLEVFREVDLNHKVTPTVYGSTKEEVMQKAREFLKGMPLDKDAYVCEYIG